MRASQLTNPNKRRLVIKDHPKQTGFANPVHEEGAPPINPIKERVTSLHGKENAPLQFNHDKLLQRTGSLGKTKSDGMSGTQSKKFINRQASVGDSRQSTHHFPPLLARLENNDSPADLKELVGDIFEALKKKLVIQQSHTVMCNIKKENLLGLMEGLAGITLPHHTKESLPPALNSIEEQIIVLRHYLEEERRKWLK